MDLLTDLVLKELYGGLWHTTPPDRFRAIVASGAILPLQANPHGWRSFGGEENCPYGTKLGGISLFDFDGFDPHTYAEKCPLSTWQTFVPCSGESAVWIEIARANVSDHLLSAADVVARWKAEEAYRHNFMPYIEAIYLGVLPCSAFNRAFVVRENDPKLYPVRLDAKGFCADWSILQSPSSRSGSG